MRILIAGLSKTGTTGLLYLVKNSLPNEVPVLFEPSACPEEWGPTSGAPVISKVLIGGALDAKSFTHFDKKVTIVRDVRDRLVSELLTGKAKVPERLERVERTKSHGERRNGFTAADVTTFKPLMTPYLR